YTFSVSANRNLVANFTANSANYTVAVSAAPSASGLVSGGGTFAGGASVTVTATANSGYTFTNWTERNPVFTNWTGTGVVVSTSPSYTFTVSGSRDLVANFAPSAPNYANSVGG